MEKSEQIERMNLEVKENLKLTDEEYEKSKDVLSRLNEMDLEEGYRQEAYEDYKQMSKKERKDMMMLASISLLRIIIIFS